MTQTERSETKRNTITVSPSRERRIAHEIVVDTYSPEEAALGWYYYLEARLGFPFRGRCIKEHPMSPLLKDEVVEVLSMAREGDCREEMFVCVVWRGRRLGVPLAQLKPVRVAATRTRKLAQQQRLRLQAVADWHYWLAMGYGF